MGWIEGYVCPATVVSLSMYRELLILLDLRIAAMTEKDGKIKITSENL
ncbi:MAG: hypothetical protein ACE5L6_02955 [Candidatus Bathyarchaeia archaeon]